MFLSLRMTKATNAAEIFLSYTHHLCMELKERVGKRKFPGKTMMKIEKKDRNEDKVKFLVRDFNNSSLLCCVLMENMNLRDTHSFVVHCDKLSIKLIWEEIFQTLPVFRTVFIAILFIHFGLKYIYDD